MISTTRVAGAVLGSTLALGTYVGTGAVASAAESDAAMDRSAPTQTFRNEANGGCLDDYDTIGGEAHTSNCSDGYGDSERWHVARIGQYAKIKNSETGRCLFDTDHSGVTLNDTCESFSGSSPWFKVLHWDDGTITFKSVISGQCLDVDDVDYPDAYVGSRDCDKSESQSWY